MLLRHSCHFWQQCWRNVRLCCQKRQQCRTSFALKFRPFDNVERCFDIVAQNCNTVEATGNKVAVFINNVERNFVLSTKSKQIEHVQFVSTLSKERNFTKNSFDVIAVFGNKVEWGLRLAKWPSLTVSRAASIYPYFAQSSIFHSRIFYHCMCSHLVPHFTFPHF